MLREETHNEWNAIIFLRRWWWYVVTTEKWKRKRWRKTQRLLTISQTQLKVMCECGPVGKKTLLTFATSVEELLKWYLACQWSVHFHPDTHPLSYSHQNTDFHSLFSHRFHRTLMLSTHTHTHTSDQANRWLVIGPHGALNTHACSAQQCEMKQMRGQRRSRWPLECRGQGSALLACPTSLSSARFLQTLQI